MIRPHYVEGEETPITPIENYRLVVERKKPFWIPRTGARGFDLRNFCPRQHPDNYINHFVFDGGPVIDYSAVPVVAEGWLGISYTWEPVAGGATPTPGAITVPNINKWKEYVKWPDLNAMNWDEIEEMNREYLRSSDKINHMWFKFSFWERLMNVMGVADAAMALIDEDCQESVHEFFDALANLYIDYLHRITNIFRIDTLFIHDDWGHSSGSFFSKDTCSEMIVPYLKRVVDAAHESGLLVDFHCCGASSSLVPCMLEAGVDFWQPQPALNDVMSLVRQYKDEHITFIVSTPELSSLLSEEEVDEKAKEFVDRYKDEFIVFGMNQSDGPNNDRTKYDVFEDAVYKYSRLAFQDYEGI